MLKGAGTPHFDYTTRVYCLQGDRWFYAKLRGKKKRHIIGKCF